MSRAKNDRSTQPVRSDSAERDDALRHATTLERHHMSRGVIAALAVYVVVIAGVLVYLKRAAPEHPGRVAVELLGFPLLVLLAFIFGTRRRAHT